MPVTPSRYCGKVLAALALGCVSLTAHAVCYDRDLYGKWADSNDDCQNTRAELLIATSKMPVQFRDRRECYVGFGQWYDQYNATVHTDARDVEIDHLVALAEAHESGAYLWNRAKRRTFANDLENLRVTASQTNFAKGKLDAGEWLPDHGRDAYMQTWIAIKRKYGLSIDKREAKQLRKHGKSAGGLKIAAEYRCR